ncbi:AbrB/MazE/SpoVT family DNA-binding domain-containing protein [Candidatus Peregrinibacteria bacterium]|jgi:bifunctional DNA-binding transcriptional regulator/antitoxin component of YhaV-PrlF toxin-antitoxin module|nr:AbrB/MazE/SpoVT family DNA-binding domain-containing protein [Candidatus Peregrinibacteria bacterium]
MNVHTLKMFNTGQITLPKSWRKKFNTKHFVAKETENGLLIQPMIQDEDVVYYEDEGGCGLHFPKGIDPQILINAINEIDGED